MSTTATKTWQPTLNGRVDPSDVPSVVLVSPFSQDTGNSGAFQAVLSDGRTCWVKPTNNRQGALVPVADQIVGRCGALIDAPVCGVSIVRIPEELRDTEVFWGLRLEPGLAHASEHVDGVFETRELGYRERDHNAVRQAGIFALSLWCHADDTEWLVSTRQDYSYFSHDHGGYLGLAKPADLSCALLRGPGAPNDRTPLEGLLGSPAGLDRQALLEFAERLRDVTMASLEAVLCSIPASWPVSNERLATVGEHLHRRAGAAADVLERLA